MILELTFELSGTKQILPLNYQYALGSWIYRVISQGDKEYAERLHKEGYRIENGKIFKLFVFSNLRFPDRTSKLIPKSDRLEIRSREAKLDIGFYVPELMSNFVKGLFENLELEIGDRISVVSMKVKYVEVQNPFLPENGPYRLRALTPIIMGFKREGVRNEVYELPDVADYGEKFLQNLAFKYEAATGKKVELEKMQFRLLTENPRSKKITIKDHTPERTEIRGYLYEFEIDAPKEIVELGLTAGFGRENSWGMGWCELVK